MSTWLQVAWEVRTRIQKNGKLGSLHVKSDHYSMVVPLIYGEKEVRYSVKGGGGGLESIGEDIRGGKNFVP